MNVRLTIVSTEENQRTLITVFQECVLFYAFLWIQNTLAATILQGSREGKVCSCNITNSLRKTQSFHTQTELMHLTAQSQNWDSLTPHGFCTHSPHINSRFR